MILDLWENKRSSAEIHETGLKILRTTTVSGLPSVLIFTPKAIKPTYNYCFRSEQQREDFIQAKVKAFAETKAMKAKWKEDRKGTSEDLNQIKIGDIFNFSWGYEQTNQDFFQVVEKKGRHVWVREIKKQSIDSPGFSSMSDHVTPVKNDFCGEPIKKLVQFSNHKPFLTMASYGWCSLWDGQPCYRSWYA